MNLLQGKTAIVTGGAIGIGRGIAECMIREGAKVVVFDLNQPDYDVMFYDVDVTSPTAVGFAVREVLNELGKIDILVNNAGIEGKPGNPFTLNSLEDWDRVLNTNLMSVLIVSQAVAPHFVGRKEGCFINISSIAALMPGPMSPPYSVSKMGVISLTKIIARQYAALGIRANAIAPGLVWTSHWERLAQENIRRYPDQFGGMTPRQVYEKRLSEIVPMKKEQTPEDVGNAAVFLASDWARNTTGEVLRVDGGVTIETI